MIKRLFKSIAGYRKARAIKLENELTIKHACVVAAGIAQASVLFWGDADMPGESGMKYDTDMIACAAVGIVMAIERKVLK
jgi:hypothetical protein